MSILRVGYIMKTSRAQDFIKRNAFPSILTSSGLMFIPISFNLPLVPQLQDVDIILHKATDEIVRIDPCSTFEPCKGILFSQGMQELLRYMDEHHNYCVIDPIRNVLPLVDRVQIQKILCDLECINTTCHRRIRAPYFLKMDDFLGRDLSEKLFEAKLCFPVIVKPQVACGIADAHKMALVFETEGVRSLKVPLPAIMQEYVDHGGSVFKFYVLGQEVQFSVRESMPNSSYLASFSSNDESKSIVFDSLKSLPSQNDGSLREGCDKGLVEQSLDVNLATAAAHWLRKKLQLTIFGFDLVIQDGTGDHVIIDLNYFPSFREVPDYVAVPAFWNALKCAYETRKKK